MGPKQKTKSTTEVDAGGDETLALRLVELLGDDAVIMRLRTALYPQMLADKMDRQSALMEQLIAQLTASNTRIQDLKRGQGRSGGSGGSGRQGGSGLKDLEDQADKTEQYTRRSNFLFSGLPETGVGEDTEEKILAIVNGKMGVQPPLSPHDIARSHRLGKRRDDKHCRPVIVRFGSDRVRDRVFRARTALEGHNAERRDAPIYINEDLTARRWRLAFDARQLKRERKVADCWTFNGKLMIKDLANKITEIPDNPLFSDLNRPPVVTRLYTCTC